MAASHTYSFLDVQCAIAGPGGVISLGGDGGAAKEGITVEPSEDIGTMQIGAGGEVMHSLHAGRPAKAMVRLLKTSSVNALLSAMFNLQASSASVYGQNTIVVSDSARGDIVSCFSAAFAKFPGVTWAEDANYNEWTFNVGRVNWNLGTGTVF